MLRYFDKHVEELKALRLKEKIVKAEHESSLLVIVELSVELDPEGCLRPMGGNVREMDFSL